MKKLGLFFFLAVALVSIQVLVLPASAELRTINQGAAVYIGELGLDITNAVGDSSQIAWWATGYSQSPSKVIDVSSTKSSFLVDPSKFVSYTGNWYRYNGSGGAPSGAPAFIVYDPSLDIRIWDIDTNTDVSGMSVVAGDRLTFLVITNQNSAVNPSYRPNANSGTDGYITIKVKDSSGTVLNPLYQTNTISNSLTNQYVDSNTWYWGGNMLSRYWATNVTDSNNNSMYPAGTYIITAESGLNGIKDNYRDPSGAVYSGKTVSQARTVTIVPESLLLLSNKDTVVRGDSFSTTISGKPNTEYYLWVKGTGQMTGAPQDQPPIIVSSQAGVFFDPTSGPFAIGNYAILNGNGKSILNDIPSSTATISNVGYYAKIKTDTAGRRTVLFQTIFDTKPQSYVVRVEKGSFFDEVPIMVQRGAVTIVAGGSQQYNSGDLIYFSGTNTETQKTYVFLSNDTTSRMLSNPVNTVANYNTATFDWANVLADHTWSYHWNTNSLNLPAGAYTIYAVGFPYDKNNLGNVSYGTVTIVLTAPAQTTNATPTTTATTAATTQSTSTATTSPTTIASTETPAPTGTPATVSTTVAAAQPSATQYYAGTSSPPVAQAKVTAGQPSQNEGQSSNPAEQPDILTLMINFFKSLFGG